MPSSELTGAVIGAFFAVHKRLGHGFLESVHRKALMVELRRRRLPFRAEVPIPVLYDDVQVGFFRADLIVADELLLEVKSTHALVPSDFRQVLNYLRGTNLSLALLLHFGPRADFHRIISSR